MDIPEHVGKLAKSLILFSEINGMLEQLVDMPGLKDRHYGKKTSS